jgi:hypothetical protein
LGASLIGGIALLVLVLYSFAHYPQQALGVVGLYLILYRLVIYTRFDAIVQVLANLCIGASLSFLAPLSSWPLTITVPVLALIGMLLSAKPVGTLVISNACLGAIVGALCWQTRIFNVVPGGHCSLVAIGILALVPVIWLTPLVRWLLPVLAAFLVVQSLAPRFGLLSQEDLLQGSVVEATSEAQLLHTLAAWLLLTLFGIALLKWSIPEQTNETTGLQEFLIMGNNGNGEGGFGLPPKGDALERLPALSEAIHLPDDADLSHLNLTDMEKQIVATCKKDEFERDRLLWGGGLY